MTQDVILVVMGPCGCGKSEVGQNLANLYQTTFLDADVYHPKENVAKMGQGIPLNDQDRVPWLQTVRQELVKEVEDKIIPSQFKSDTTHGDQDKPTIAGVLACSALKRMYRDILRGKDGQTSAHLKLVFILLNCSSGILQQRLQSRSGHFMKTVMLESQLKTLELPEREELPDFVVVNGDLPLKEVVHEIYQKLSSIISLA